MKKALQTAAKFAWKVVRNRYLLVLLIAVVWMALFDRYNLPSMLRLQAQVSELEEDRNYYQHEIERLKQERTRLQTDLQELERIAREEYLMHRANEDVYVVQPAKDD